jgi:ParB family transcriptional regulator, chromosome partitioning protein
MLPASSPQLVDVRLDCLQLSPTNPRKQFDATRHAELTASIAAQGVLVPLLCRPLPSTQLEVVAGARRYHAAKAAGLVTVPAIVRMMTDIEALEVQIIENLQRDDVHPLDEGEAYQMLLATAGYDVTTLIAKLGKARRDITQRLQLTTLTPELQTAFREDRISTRHAFLIARLEPQDQAAALQACYRPRWSLNGEREQLISVAELAEWIEQNLYLHLRRAPFSAADPTLLPEAGACTTCPKRTGYVPDLFPDVAGEDTCTDRACFARKLDAYLTQRRQALTCDGTAPLELSTVHGFTHKPDESGPLPQSRWVEAEPESCAHTTQGLIVYGNRVGTALTVCAAPQCTTHWVMPPSGASSDRDERRAQQRAQQLELTIRDAILTEILSRVVTPLPRVVANHIASIAFERLWFEYQKATLARYPWGKTVQHNLTGAVAAQVPSFSDTELTQFMVTMLLIGDLRLIDTHRPKKTLLDEIATLYDVDTSAIRKQVTSTLEAKEAKRDATRKTRQSRQARAAATTT